MHRRPCETTARLKVQNSRGSLSLCPAPRCRSVPAPRCRSVPAPRYSLCPGELYPVELVALVSCEALPLELRRLYALVTYLFLRGGELKALTWPDVDIERGIISVRRSFDRTAGRIKQTKTGNKGMRRFAVEPELLPLLCAMHDEANGQGPVVDMRQQKWWAADLRKHLELAGITREALFDTDDTRKRLRFHDLRGTGLTWMASRGDDPLMIQQRAGHRTFEMTQKYIRTAEAVGKVIGATFPPLPDCLTTAAVAIHQDRSQRGAP